MIERCPTTERNAELRTPSRKGAHERLCSSRCYTLPSKGAASYETGNGRFLQWPQAAACTVSGLTVALKPARAVVALC